MAIFGYGDLQLPSGPYSRLLTVEAGTATSIVRCSLRIVNLDESPRYTALSYTWDKTEPLQILPSSALMVAVLVAQQAVCFGTIAICLVIYSAVYLLDIALAWLFGLVSFRTIHISQVSGYPTEPSSKSTISVFQIASRKFLGSVMTKAVGWTLLRKDTTTRTVSCNGQAIRVSPNLYQALHHLRQSRPGDYWIDQLCIDQSNSKEKGSQIQMMGRIYQSAELVSVWLESCPTLLSGQMEVLTSMFHAEEFLPGTESRPYSAIIHLLTRHWFQRVWVIQEVALAQKLVFLVGKFEFSVEDMVFLIKLVEAPSDLEVQGIIRDQRRMWSLPSLYGSGIFPASTSATMMAREAVLVSQRWSLEDWLRHSTALKATQHQDYIYAGLSLIRPETLRIDQSLQLDGPTSANGGEQMGLPPITTRRLWPEIRADQQTAPMIPEIFLNVAACLLSSEDGIKRLLNTIFAFRDPDLDLDGALDPPPMLPSWIPNPTAWSSRVPESLALCGEDSFTACTTLPTQPEISSDGRVLYLEMAILDTVSEVGLGPEHLVEFMRWAKHQSNRLSMQKLAHVLVAGVWDGQYSEHPTSDAVVGLCELLYSELVRLTDVLVQSPWEGAAAIEEMHKNGSHAGKAKFKQLRDGRSKRVDVILQHFLDLKAAYPQAPWPQEQLQTFESSNHAKNFHRNMSTALKERKLFVTGNGLFGIGPRTLMPGDEVMLIKGSPVPYIMVPAGALWKRQATDLSRKIIRKSEGDSAARAESRCLKEKLDIVEKRILGGETGRVVLGEVFLEGKMQGHAAVEASFSRVGVV